MKSWKNKKNKYMTKNVIEYYFDSYYNTGMVMYIYPNIDFKKYDEKDVILLLDQIYNNNKQLPDTFRDNITKIIKDFTYLNDLDKYFFLNHSFRINEKIELWHIDICWTSKSNDYYDEETNDYIEIDYNEYPITNKKEALIIEELMSLIENYIYEFLDNYITDLYPINSYCNKTDDYICDINLYHNKIKAVIAFYEEVSLIYESLEIPNWGRKVNYRDIELEIMKNKILKYIRKEKGDLKK
jgi:hypothetical protein